MRHGWNRNIYNVVTLQNAVSFKAATQHVDRSRRTASRRSVTMHRPRRLLLLIEIHQSDALTAHSLALTSRRGSARIISSRDRLAQATPDVLVAYLVADDAHQRSIHFRCSDVLWRRLTIWLNLQTCLFG